ncbi:hypothetical protein DQ04_04521070 [Trypanosoma grayi]|uniref:hypothetical protein n=1 Tax=Trypanosoma grayi TaxID=71804 RepID=UPI0004F47BE2|nr:hypothetical protein DQ04_04521070 [Trypanosoma grayi]KEG09866.1 hypothetical protein DQ04_04521070 [Trypanosoma grayi]
MRFGFSSMCWSPPTVCGATLPTFRTFSLSLSLSLSFSKFSVAHLPNGSSGKHGLAAGTHGAVCACVCPRASSARVIAAAEIRGRRALQMGRRRLAARVPSPVLSRRQQMAAADLQKTQLTSLMSSLTLWVGSLPLAMTTVAGDAAHSRSQPWVFFLAFGETACSGTGR